MGVIRLILALFVVFFHCGDFFFKTMPGPIAVQSFYIISGFYMALILNEKYTGKNSYKLFLTNRLLRLYPIYWTVLLIFVLTYITLHLATGSSTFTGLSPIRIFDPSMNAVSIAFMVFTNLFIFGQDVVMFLGLNPNTGNVFFTSNYALSNPQLHTFLLIPQAWTVGMELMFYLIAPFIVRRSFTVLSILFSFSILIKILLYKNGLDFDPWTYRFFPAELTFFLLGIFSYRIYKVLKNKKINIYLLRFVYASVIIVLIFYPFLHYYIRVYFYFVGFFVALPFVFIYSKGFSIDREIGEYSYPVYICHVFVRNILGFTLKIPFNLSVVTTIGSLFYSFLLYTFLSKRIERLRQRRVRYSLT